MSKIPGRPFAETKIAQYLTKQIDRMASKKSQREIAAEIGYERPNMLSMIKYGDSRVPLDKIPLIAKALEVDVAFLFRLALEQYWPDLNKAIADVGIEVLTKQERDLVKKARDATEENVPFLNDAKTREFKKLLNS